jgi:hypothetical protein
VRRYIRDDDAGCLPDMLTHETKLERETAEKTVRRQWSEERKLEKETKEKKNENENVEKHRQEKEKQETKGNK